MPIPTSKDRTRTKETEVKINRAEGPLPTGVVVIRLHVEDQRVAKQKHQHPRKKIHLKLKIDGVESVAADDVIRKTKAHAPTRYFIGS
jgi:hypothetical protein